MSTSRSTPERTSEQAIIDEVLARQWATQKQIDQTVKAIGTGTVDGPLPTALFEQRLITHEQRKHLEEFFHKDLQIERFRVVRRIGSGAMGDVYLATTDDGQQVALKVINRRYADDEQFVKRFRREIEALTDLHHPNIANPIGFGEHDGLPYLAMEFVPGPSLSQLLEHHGPLPAAYVVRAMIQIAQGLDYVYEATRLVHRDVKPENILTVPNPDAPEDDLFDRHDSAKLIDFGLARSYEGDERLTMTGITMGTPHFMSPEQIRGSQELDSRSDIYGMGATMYNLLTGRTPFRGTSPGAVMTAHLTDPVPDPKQHVPGLREDVRRIVMTAMAKEPGDRFLSYQGFISACERALGELTGGDGGGIKLLRKPLVLDKPQAKRPAARSSDRQRRPSSSQPTTDPFEAAASTRRGADAAACEPREATRELIRVQSDRIRKQKKDPISTALYGLQRPRSRRIDRERTDQALTQEIDSHPGLGLMPIVVLAVALVALGGVLIYKLVM